MIVIGIHDGHNCGATVVENGKVLASVLEERLTRKKNEFGFPAKSITECLKITKNTKKKLTMLYFPQNICIPKNSLAKYLLTMMLELMNS